MRNKYAGTCYRCGQKVDVGEGHFERYDKGFARKGWRTQHASCAIKYRGTKQKFSTQSAAFGDA